MKKALLICLLFAVSVLSFGCAGSGSGDTPAIWSSNMDQVATTQE